MIDFVTEKEIARPPATVFAYATDHTKLASWQTNTISAEPDGPIAIGTRIREVHRAPGGKQIPAVVEIVEYEPDRAFGLHTVEGMPVHARITVEPTAAGTRFRFRVQWQPTGLMRIIQPFLKATLKRQFERHCTNLKNLLEDSGRA
jgi:uncharacterized protein YndB with AHSA1/START domain